LLSLSVVVDPLNVLSLSDAASPIDAPLSTARPEPANASAPAAIPSKAPVPAFVKALAEEAAPGKRVAFCVVGSLRTFPLRRVHESFMENFITAIEPRPENRDIFFHVSRHSNCVTNCCCKTPEFKPFEDKFNSSFIDSIIQTKFSPVSTTYADELDCGHPGLSNHSCCRAPVRSRMGYKESNSFFAYQRKRLCLQQALEHESQNGFQYDLFVVARPDLAFFEPVYPASIYLHASPRVYISAKEHSEEIGDFFYVIPRQLVNAFTSALSDFATEQCDRLSFAWPPEYHFSPHIRTRIPHQLVPFNFVIVRTQGFAECDRLSSVIFHHHHGLRRRGVIVTPEQYCEALRREQYFSIENSDQPMEEVTR